MASSMLSPKMNRKTMLPIRCPPAAVQEHRRQERVEIAELVISAGMAPILHEEGFELAWLQEQLEEEDDDADANQRPVDDRA